MNTQSAVVQSKRIAVILIQGNIFSSILTEIAVFAIVLTELAVFAARACRAVTEHTVPRRRHCDALPAIPAG